MLHHEAVDNLQRTLSEFAVIDPHVCMISMSFDDYLVWSSKMRYSTFLVITGMCSSLGEANRLAKQSGIRINWSPIKVVNRTFSPQDLAHYGDEIAVVISRGKTQQNRWIIRIDNLL